MSAASLLYPGSVNPPLDGKTPVFEEMGADPRVAGADRPPASVAKIGTLYLSKCGLGVSDWHPLPCDLVAQFGVSTMGNTAGQTGLVDGSFVLVGGAGITLSQATNSLGGTITINGQTGTFSSAQLAVRAGTELASSGTVLFADSNGLTFGMSGSSQITGSYSQSTAPAAFQVGASSVTAGTVVLSASNGLAFGLNGSTITGSYSQSTAPAALAASGGTITAGTASFADGSGVSFGISGQTVTASVAAGATATGNLGAIAAGTQTATAGTVVFADSNGVTFGMSGSSQVTASHNGVSQVGAQDFGGGAGVNNGVPRWVWASRSDMNVAFTKSVNGTQASIFAHAAAAAIADGAGTQTSGTVQFSNANGVTFGLNAGTMTASVAAGLRQVSFWEALALKHANVQSAEVTRLLFQRINIQAPIAATLAQLMMNVSNSNNAGGTVAYSFGVYTMSGSTANLASSASRTWAYNSTLAGSSYTDIQQTNYRSMTLGTWSLSQGDYLFALQFRVTTALTSGTYQWLGGEDISIAGYDYGTGPVSYFNHGKFSASTAAFPASVHATAIQGAGFAAAYFFPYFQLVGTH